MPSPARRHNAAESEPRAMPASMETEQAVLGAVLLNNDVFRRVSDILKEEHFHEDLHRHIWHVIAGLIEKGQAATPITCRPYLADVELAPGMNPGQYLVLLSRNACTPAYAVDHARIIFDLWLRRRLIGLCQDIEARAYEAKVEEPAGSLVVTLENELEGLRPSGASSAIGEFQTFDTAADKAVRRAQDSYKSRGKLVGLSTGIPRLDDAMGGLQPSDLIIVAGRPGMGKSALATNIGFAVSKHLYDQALVTGERTGVVAIFSLEMSEDQLANRIIAEQSGVPSWKVGRGWATEDEMLRYIDARRELSRLPLLIDPTGGLSISSLKMRARALHKKQKIAFLIVDYLQLLEGGGRKGDNRVQELTEITSGLKALAKELNVPLMALAQVSRKCEERDDKRPMLSDLRESGSIEQDADIVLFVYRDEYYLRHQKVPPEGSDARARYEREMRRVTGVAEVIIGKARHGPSGSVELGFQSNVMKFVNEPEPREPEPAGEEAEAERRERKKKVSLSKDALTLYGVLRSLSLTRSTVPTEEQRRADRALHKEARLVSVDDARSAFGRETMGPDSENEDKVKTRFSAMFKELRSAEKAFYTRSGNDWYVWLPEMVGN
ncbi:MAG TPA: replicative DNA helicase [Beijerinckiaceae bacterium]|nr:replicative DNA helicase [Beijerinckiaceae bacterium]